ncbi:MAG: RHS repeat-associated core domain-containing protein, partial [Colwellia sp.]
VSHSYDDFGQKATDTLPDGTTVTYTLDWCVSNCPQNAVYYSTVTTTDSISTNHSKTYFDALQRKVAASTLGFDGSDIQVDYLYDSLGRQYKTSLPYFASTETPIYKENTEYDILNRVKVVTHPINTSSTITYDGLTTTYTNAKNQQKFMVKNALGETITSTNDVYKVLSLEYDALGNLVATTDEAGNSVIMNYDVRSNKTSMTDPDKGHWKYEYNELGQLVLQTDAKNQSTCMVYDVLGRMTKRIDDYLAGNTYETVRANALNNCAGDGSNSQTTNWTFDTSPVNGKGKLHTVSNGSDYSKTMTYDSLGRVSNKAITINSKPYNVGKTYYANSSKVDTMVYPQYNGSSFTVRNSYKPTGFLYKTHNYYNSSEVYWQVTDMNARGQLTDFTLGNGVSTTNTYDPETGFIEVIDSLKGGVTGIQYLDFEYDVAGNLEHRKDFIKGLSEQFGYDEINRFTGSTITGTDASGSAFREDEVTGYDNNGLGNIQSKTGVGIYTYGSPSASCAVNFAGPHAVTSISGGSVQSGTNYCYDQNGDMTSGAGRTIEYTAFGKPSLITKGTSNVEFIYGPNRTRTQRIDNGLTTTTYVEGIYEEQETSGVLAGKYYIGNYVVVTKEASSTQTNYLHRDHLGSVDAITDTSGVPVAGQQMSFDAWGKRRQATWDSMSSLDLFNFNAQITKRGYTNHEQVDSMGLIHMNGRVYDPILARFISADPVVQAPDDMQSYNRYSYVRNNPLAYTDPTGYSWLRDKGRQFDKWQRSESERFARRNNDLSNALYAVALPFPYGFIHGTKYSETYRFGSNVAAGYLDGIGCAGLCSAAVAGAQTHIMGGDLEDVAKSAAFAYAGSQMTMGFKEAKIIGWKDIAQRSLYRGTLSGAQSWANGGSFAKGFGRAALVQGSLDSIQFYIESNANVDADPNVWPGSGVDLQKKVNGLSISDASKTNLGIAREHLGYHPNSIDAAGNIVLGGKTNWFTDIPYEGSWFMNTVNMVPGMNYMSAFHDTWAGAWGMEAIGTGITILHATAVVEGIFYMQHRNNEYHLRNSVN